MSSAQNTRRVVLGEGAVSRLERMIEIREFENRVNDLFAEGVIHGTTHLCLGQEALAVGLAATARIDDVVAATYRSHGIALALGMTPESVLAEIMGKATGCTGGMGGSMHLSDAEVGLLPTSAIIGAGMPIAVGAAVAFVNRGEERVAISVFGDGGSNIGAFHEALNMAAVWQLPVVFVCDNNLYGEYSRINLTTSIEDIHRRASAYGIPGTVVDGMDVDAVQNVLATAIARARSGGGPTLVEAKTYRFAGHSRADKATYRPDGELESWLGREPVALTARTLIQRAEIDASGVEALTARIRDELEAIVERVRNAPEPTVASMFTNIFAQVS
jgi:TPP-dependent pyruvate/acetoin dehydrogenase alpha subunit